MNDQMFRYGGEDIFNDDESPGDEEWGAYYEYLLYVKSRIKEVRKRFQMNSD